MKTGFISHVACLEHETGIGHPESPRRLSVLQKYFLNQTQGDRIQAIHDGLINIIPNKRDDVYQWISEVHFSDYTQSLKTRIPERGKVYLDPDTPVSPASLGAAEWAVSGVLTAIDRVMDGTIQNAFCAIRPPGHHAEPDHAMGFCLFNNIAVAARYIQKKYRLKRVLILDWDVHHGNGTQHVFYDDPDIFYFSLHQYPFYPGTGGENERGLREGEGFTRNAPMMAGSGDREIISRFEQDLAHVLDVFVPDFILISAGFDAHRDDPLAGLEVTESGFKEMTKTIQSIADTQCSGRIVSCLEGGYQLDALVRSVAAHLEGFGNLPDNKP